MKKSRRSHFWQYTSLTISILGFGGFLLWGSTAALTSASLATGNIAVKGQKKAIQHLEGGIVETIHVNEGDRVTHGQRLISLSQKRAQSYFQQTQTKHTHAKAMLQRLRAEQELAPKIIFNGFDRSNAATEAILQSQENLFLSRRQKQLGDASLAKEKKSQAIEQLHSLEARINSDKQQNAIALEQVTMHKNLQLKGYSSKAQYLTVQSQQQSIAGRISEYQAHVLKAKAAVDAAEQEIENLHTNYVNHVTDEIEEQQKLLSVLSSEMSNAKDILSRTSIYSPIAGHIVDMKVHTLGGVISPRETLMEIVPENTELIVEAFLDPKDIESVRIGMQAKIRLPSYNYRSVPPIDGTVESVSADRIFDEERQMSAYKIQISLIPDSYEVEIFPGMPAQVFVILNERTPLDYLLSPILKSSYMAFREVD